MKNDGGQDDIAVIFEMWSTNWRREKGMDRSKDVMMKVIYSKDGYFKRDYPKMTLQIRFIMNFILGSCLVWAVPFSMFSARAVEVGYVPPVDMDNVIWVVSPVKRTKMNAATSCVIARIHRCHP